MFHEDPPFFSHTHTGRARAHVGTPATPTPTHDTHTHTRQNVVPLHWCRVTEEDRCTFARCLSFVICLWYNFSTALSGVTVKRKSTAASPKWRWCLAENAKASTRETPQSRVVQFQCLMERHSPTSVCLTSSSHVWSSPVFPGSVTDDKTSVSFLISISLVSQLSLMVLMAFPTSSPPNRH